MKMINDLKRDIENARKMGNYSLVDTLVDTLNALYAYEKPTQVIPSCATFNRARTPLDLKLSNLPIQTLREALGIVKTKIKGKVKGWASPKNYWSREIEEFLIEYVVEHQGSFEGFNSEVEKNFTDKAITSKLHKLGYCHPRKAKRWIRS